MGHKSVEEYVKEVVVEIFGAKANNLTMETQLINDLQADSLDLVELTLALENRFGFAIKDSEADAVMSKPNCTVGDIVNFIKSKL